MYAREIFWKVTVISTSLKRAVPLDLNDRERELIERLMDRAEEHDTGWAEFWWVEMKSLRRKLYGLED